MTLLWLQVQDSAQTLAIPQPQRKGFKWRHLRQIASAQKVVCSAFITETF